MKRVANPINVSNKRTSFNDETKLDSSFLDDAVPPHHFHLGEDIYAAVTYFATEVHLQNDSPSEPKEIFKKRDRQARVIIKLNIENLQIIHIKCKATVKATPNKLKSIHERSILSRKLFLPRKLYATRMSEVGNMNEHIPQMLQLIHKLKAAGEEIKDDHFAALFLVSIPTTL
ncbi:retrovirus-related Pol polyprotein from transposon TNT 1-94 [Nephila pilipes]|uniref:Retrovirus-related Pol polyprotein from transposon TNT 1-94 n=1 Tax=Nephila pilipes TaxID=299642 RepID=A0A8X6PNP4_NEPPI|nr:retrovirus-related Pol polyprotein from transposon TNT 1-94 [Nephila pilipes]